jgi:tRNA(fMet)-specific endonuclease VapC
MICLDTNVVIGVLNRRASSLVWRFDREVINGDIALPVIALFELEFGIAKSKRPSMNAHVLATFLKLPITILPFKPQDAREAGDILATLERAGTPIGPYDILIAAQARRRGATLVTANTREFARVPGLRLNDWTAAETS